MNTINDRVRILRKHLKLTQAAFAKHIGVPSQSRMGSIERGETKVSESRIMLICKDLIAQYFFSDRQYAYVVYISAMATLVSATNGIISAPTRMQNKRKVFLVTNTLSSVLSYSISIPFT